jgi:uncharacterized repeat protein (TIGR01451 family)
MCIFSIQNSMKNWQKFPRAILILLLLTGLLAFFDSPMRANESANAAQLFQAGTRDISIVNKVNGEDSVQAKVCSRVVFTLDVKNDGTTDVTDIEVYADLTPALQYISHTSGMVYNTVDDPWIWDVGTLGPDETKTLSITAQVISSDIITFHAEVPGSTSSNNMDESTVNPIPGTNADLEITQNWIRSTSDVGTVDLVIGVKHLVPDPAPVSATGPATGIQVEDKLPSGLTYVSHTPGLDYDSSSGIWTIGSLAVNGTAELTITAKVNKRFVDDPGTRNTAKIVYADQCDLYPGNNETIENILVADLRVTEAVDFVGLNALFTISVTNDGPDEATGVKLKSALPTLTSAYTFISAGSPIGSYDVGTGVWDVGVLTDGAGATLTITTAVEGPLLADWVEVIAVDQVDPDSVPINGSRKEDDGDSAPPADLSVTKSVNKSGPQVGSNVIFTITVSNEIPVSKEGRARASNVQVKDLLPAGAGLTYVSYTSSAGTTYDYRTGIWEVGALDVDTNKTLAITARVDSLGVKINWAEVWSSDSSDPDSTPGNGSTTEDDDASASITPIPGPTPTPTRTLKPHAPRTLLINEVAWMGTFASSSDEWIELYNPGTKEINLAGWKLKTSDGGLLVNLEGTIGPERYFLLAHDKGVFNDVTPKQIFSGFLNNYGPSLQLLDASNKVIDIANSDFGYWPAGIGYPTFASMERYRNVPDGQFAWVTFAGTIPSPAHDRDGNVVKGTPGRGNWAYRITITPTLIGTTTRTPTPSRTPTLIPVVGRPVINEFLARPGFDWNRDGKVDVFDEFIEIKNYGVADVNIGGWKLDDEANQGSTAFTLPSVVLKPGQRAVFYGLQTNILLSDGGDTVRLLNPSGKVYDAYTYSLVKVEDRSVCRLPDGSGSWYEDCVPTPNLINSREGAVPSMPDDKNSESPVCLLPDTLPADFLFAECHGYGSDIWNPFYWDEAGWQGEQPIPENWSKWNSFVE